MTVATARRRFNVHEYYRMAEVGILVPDERLELIEGEIITKSPISSRHAACDTWLNARLLELLGKRAIISVRNPVRLDNLTEPEPDLMILRPKADFYNSAHPGPGDVLLVIEVMDTSADYDRGVKLPLYARAGIAETWLIDLARPVVEVYRRPEAGAYAEAFAAGRGESVSPSAFPDVALNVVDIPGAVRP